MRIGRSLLVLCLGTVGSCGQSATTAPVAHALEEPSSPMTAPLPVPLPKPNPWWTASSPCPNGATFEGSPPPDGTMVSCRDANSDGRRTTWYPSGALQSDGVFVGGAPDGLYQSWREDGSKQSEITYRAGRPDGPSRHWFANGKPSLDGVYQQGKREGAWRVWLGDGTLEAGTYRDDARTGTWTVVDPSGTAAHVDASTFDPAK